MSYLQLTRRDLEEAVNIVDRCPEVVADIEAKMPTGGRPRQHLVRVYLLGLFLLARHGSDFHIKRLPELLQHLPKKRLQLLGLRSKNEIPSVRQIGRAHRQIADMIDPYAPDISEEQARERIEFGHWISYKLLAATIPDDVTQRSEIAVDATLLESWATPGNAWDDPAYSDRDLGKDADGDDFSNATLSSLHEQGLLTDPYDEGLPENYRPKVKETSKDRSAAWIGGKDRSKILFGHALHIGVLANQRHEESLPLVATSMHLTPAPAAQARAGLEMITAYAKHSKDDGIAKPLGRILADGGYSGAKNNNWQLPIKAMGGEPIFRLHAQNQEGLRRTENGVSWIDGRPYCPCIPAILHNLKYPRFLQQKTQRAEYRLELAKRQEFAFTAHGKFNADGSRRFKAPHKGGCAHCADRTIDQRCCQQATHKFDAADLARYQPNVFGTTGWGEDYTPRARVEGYNGVLKDIGNYVRGAARFTNYGKNWWATLFRMMSTNLHLVETWRARLEERAKRKAAPQKKRRRKRRSDAAKPVSDYAKDPGVHAHPTKGTGGKSPTGDPPAERAKEPKPKGGLSFLKKPKKK